jgi:hypothetical protein
MADELSPPSLPALDTPAAATCHALEPRVRVDAHGRSHALQKRQIGDAIAVKGRVLDGKPVLFGDATRKLDLTRPVAHRLLELAREATPFIDLELGAYDVLDTELARQWLCGVGRRSGDDGYELPGFAMTAHRLSTALTHVLENITLEPLLTGCDHPILSLAPKVGEGLARDALCVDHSHGVLQKPPRDAHTIAPTRLAPVAAVAGVERSRVRADQRPIHVEERRARSVHDDQDSRRSFAFAGKSANALRPFVK